MTAAQILDQVEQAFIDHKLPHDMDAIRACAAPAIDRIAQLDLFQVPRVPVWFLPNLLDRSVILWDFFLGDHFARVVLHLGRLWIYHDKPGTDRYAGSLQRIDETPLWIEPQAVAEMVINGRCRKVWPR